MRTFQMVRDIDLSGISGTGLVAEGVEFGDGRVALRWCVPGRPTSVAVWDEIEDVLAIHGHDGTTRIEWER
jgi:hypothetical protein